MPTENTSIETPKIDTSVAPPDRGFGEVKSDPQASYIASSTAFKFYIGDRALPQSIDDLERDFGYSATEGVYGRMFNEPILGGITDGLILATIEPGIDISPRFSVDQELEVNSEDQYDADQSKKVAEYVKEIFAHLELNGGSLADIYYDLLLAIVFGHRLAEATTKICDSGEFKGLEVLESIVVKPRENYAFVLDHMNKFRGVMAIVPGVSMLVRQGFVFDASGLANVIAPEKLILLTIGAREGNPQGRPWYRSAYSPWYEKQIARQEELKYIAQHAGGKITGTTPENAKSADPTKTPELEMAENLMNMVNGGVGAFPYGSEVTVHYPTGTSPFDAYNDRRDREMVLAVTKQIRATLEAQYGSKADSGTAQNTLDKVHNYLRKKLCEAFAKFLRPVVARNLGLDAATKYFPTITMATVNAPDFAADVVALAAAGYTFDPGQFPWIDNKYGIGPRPKDWIRPLVTPQTDTQPSRTKTLEKAQ